MNTQRIELPEKGQRITMGANGRLNVPELPIIPFIEGDGIGPEIMRAAMIVWNAAVDKAYGTDRCVQWVEICAGSKAERMYGEGEWLPAETIETIRSCLVAIKSPLTTPVGEGIRSLNVALRQELDLYVCLRPVRWFEGVPSPVKHPEHTNMVVFRENSEDIYAGIEWAEGTPEVRQVLEFLRNDMHVDSIRFPDSSGIGIKPISREGTERLVRAAVEYARKNGRSKVTLVHKGNIMKYTEGAFKKWGYELVRSEFKGIAAVSEDHPAGIREGCIAVNDVIADAFFQQILTRPEDYSVVATTNLNGDYISDALAACVGGIGIAPGANINFEKGIAVFEATHGTAPRYTGQDKVNPSSLILSGEMMFRYLGWDECADLVLQAIAKAFRGNDLTYDLARFRTGSRQVACSDFARLIASLMAR